MIWHILPVAGFAVLALLGVFIGFTSSDAGTVRYGYVLAIIGGISTFLFSIELARARRRAKTPRGQRQYSDSPHAASQQVAARHLVPGEDVDVAGDLCAAPAEIEAA